MFPFRTSERDRVGGAGTAMNAAFPARRNWPGTHRCTLPATTISRCNSSVLAPILPSTRPSYAEWTADVRLSRNNKTLIQFNSCKLSIADEARSRVEIHINWNSFVNRIHPDHKQNIFDGLSEMTSFELTVLLSHSATWFPAINPTRAATWLWVVAS